MRVTICRGQTSLVRVEQRGRVRYFNAGRYLSEQGILRLLDSTVITLRDDIEPEREHVQRELYQKGRERRDGLRLHS